MEAILSVLILSAVLISTNGQPVCSDDLVPLDSTQCGCPALPSPANGMINSTDITMIGGTVSYSCNAGFGLEGEETRTCTPNGWDGVDPICAELVECYLDNGCSEETNPLFMTRRQCCVDTLAAVGFKVEASENCNICIVFGFFNTTFKEAEQGQGYALDVGYLKRPANAVNLPFTVGQEFLGSTSSSDFTLQTTSVFVATTQESRQVTFTFLVDAIAQELDENVKLILALPPAILGQFPGQLDNNIFFLNCAELCIMDSDTLDIQFTEEDYRSGEQELMMNVRVTKSNRIATPVTVSVTPVEFAEHRNTSRPFPSEPADDNNGRSPIEADQDDFDNSTIFVTFQPDEIGAQMNDLNTPVPIVDDAINEAEEQDFVVTLDIVSATNTDPSSLTISRKDALCRIIDDDDIALGFEQRFYTFPEPELEVDITDVVFIAKENNVISEQTFLIVVTVTGNTPGQTIRSADVRQGETGDYQTGAETGNNFLLLRVEPSQQRIPFNFRLFGDDISEGSEAFQVTTAAHENSPSILVPTVLSPNTFIIIEDDDIVIIGFESLNYTVNEPDELVEICAVVTFPATSVPILADIFLGVNTTEGTADENDYDRIVESEGVVLLLFNNANRRDCFNLEITDDSLVEDTESLTIELVLSSFFMSPSGVVLDPNVTTVEIVDNDDNITIGWESSRYNVSEDSGQVEICAVIMSPSSDIELLIEDFYLAVNTHESDLFGFFGNFLGAMSDVDYTSLTGEIIGPFGDQNRRACVTVNITDDDINEPFEPFISMLEEIPGISPPPEILTISDENTTIYIEDNDVIIIGFESTNYTVNETTGFDFNVFEICGEVKFPPDDVPILGDHFFGINTIEGTADNTDYIRIIEPQAIVVLFFTNNTRRSCFNLDIIDDSLAEDTERLTIEMVYSSFFNIPRRLFLSPNVTTVEILDSDVPITIGWESSRYDVNEGSGQVEICAVITSPSSDVQLNIEDFNLAVNTQDASAEGGVDYISLIDQTIGPFGDQNRRACVTVDITDDSDAEPDETFNGVLEVVPGPMAPPSNLVTISPNTTIVNIEDNDDTGPTPPPVNDTIVGDPLLTAPLLITDKTAIPNIEADEPVNLCYEVKAKPDAIFNLVSDVCVTVNAHYSQVRPNENLNIIDAIYVRAVDTEGNCINIAVNLDQCMPSVNSTEIQMFDSNGVYVRKIRNRVRIAVPNCQDQDLVMWVFCQNTSVQSTINEDESFKTEMIRFVISRGLSLLESSHGILGQFWNVPVDVERFNESLNDGSDPGSNAYKLTVNYPGQVPRVFVGWLYRITWEKRHEYCIYAGNGQGGSTFEVPDPFNDPVLEGRYTDYMIINPFDTEYQFNHFEEERCN